MKSKLAFFQIPVFILLSISILIVSPGCGKDKYSQFKSEDYEKAWKQMNTFVLENKGETFSLRDIKKDYLVKAATFELVRRAENPEKKSPVETMSKSEEELILSAWKKIIEDAIREDIFFQAFSENLELAAQLIIHSGRTKEEAYNYVSRHIFFVWQKFDEAIAFNEKSGKTTEEACKVIMDSLSVMGSGASAYFIGHEDEMIEFLQKAGMSREDAAHWIASIVANHYVAQLVKKKLSEEETAENLKEVEKQVRKYLVNEKDAAKVMGSACLSRDLSLRAAEYFQAAGDEEGLKDAYKQIADQYFYKEDYKNALIYYEKAGEKEAAEACRRYMEIIKRGE